MKEGMFQAIALAKIEDKTLTKREQFAIAALQGLATQKAAIRFIEADAQSTFAEMVVGLADAVIKKLGDTEEEESDTAQEAEEDGCDCPGCTARREGRDVASLDEVLQFIFKKAMQ